MNEQDHLEKPMLVEKDRLVANKKHAVKPWSRFWARYIDVFVFGSITGLLWGFIHYESLDQINELLLGVIILIVWVFVEACLLSSIGYTLGKWLFRIKVRDQDGNNLTFSAARSRGVRVVLRGMGLDLPIISFFTKLFAYIKLQDTGTTAWDAAVGSKVSYGDLSVFRKIMLTIIVICIIIYVIWLYTIE